MDKERKFLVMRAVVSFVLAVVAIALGVWFITFFNLESFLAWLCIAFAFALGICWIAYGVCCAVKFSKGGAVKPLKKPSTFLHYFLMGGSVFGAIVYLIKPLRRGYEPLIEFARSCFKDVFGILLLAIPVWIFVSFFVAFTGWLVMVYYTVKFLFVLLLSHLGIGSSSQWKAVYEFDGNRKIYVGKDDYLYTEKGDKTYVRLIGNEIYNIDNQKIGEISGGTLTMSENEMQQFRV